MINVSTTHELKIRGFPCNLNMKYKIRLLYFVSEENVKKIINNQKYNNIYNNENIFSDLTNFNEKYLVI